jgi:hypothetical protein
MTTEPLPPVAVTVIGGTGDGGAPLTSGTIATTPDHQPNLVTTVITPIAAIVVRFVNQFLTSLVGLVMAGMTPAGGRVLQADDFLHLVLTCAGLSVAGAGLGLLKDLVTIFGRLEGKYPLLTGSV